MSDPALIREHVQKILASPGFANADRLRRFLEFTVEAQIKGESAQIKEYVLGREVFDRSEDYDPRLDPIVRVEARRLRQRLAEYYAGPGRDDKVRIDYPKGSYAASISTPELTKKPNRLVRSLALPVIAIGIAAGAYFYNRRSVPDNALAIVPARWTFLDPAGLDPSDEAVAEAITAQVANNGKIPVIGWPSILPFRTNPQPGPELAKATGAATVLAISVRVTGAGSRVTVFLVEPFTGRKRWAEDFYSQELNTPQAIRALAQTITNDLEITLGHRH
jgi:TolB-like protein